MLPVVIADSSPVIAATSIVAATPTEVVVLAAVLTVIVGPLVTAALSVPSPNRQTPSASRRSTPTSK
ncbi:hypothetical protein EA472_13485 [Natrarchaeobius oligotrophus]|uniref:Uncharacterized protein n=1 Tax=Natrarchaeobius chitinivorans TaxID=1679083 RepID=A0A3N6PL84_NATCH|nr:hypothetical protein EA472_13485 [Natrarchaeobius chitinivorans]